MAHPDVAERRMGHEGLINVIEAAARLGATYVTLCTGTRATQSMWIEHPQNGSIEAWRDCRDAIELALDVATARDVTLLIEPEPANVVASAKLARKMLREVDQPRLKIVLDPANIVLSDLARSPEVVLSEAFDLLGPDIVFAHAKDLSGDGKFCAAGTGIVHWEHYFRLLDGIGYSGPIIFHTLTEADVHRALSLISSRAESPHDADEVRR
jgi:sugar phosphate isomerase/epimerase